MKKIISIIFLAMLPFLCLSQEELASENVQTSEAISEASVETVSGSEGSIEVDTKTETTEEVKADAIEPEVKAKSSIYVNSPMGEIHIKDLIILIETFIILFFPIWKISKPLAIVSRFIVRISGQKCPTCGMKTHNTDKCPHCGYAFPASSLIIWKIIYFLLINALVLCFVLAFLQAISNA
ncbi:MAG: hypothetical protein R3Y46_07550 [Opitutales bacterium]